MHVFLSKGVLGISSLNAEKHFLGVASALDSSKAATYIEGSLHLSNLLWVCRENGKFAGGASATI